MQFTPIISIPIKPSIDDLSLLLSFIQEVICSNNLKIYDYLLQWIKNICVYNKNTTAILLYSQKQGTGKNTFINFLINLIGPNLCYISNSLNEVMNTHTDLSGKILVNVNELITDKNNYYFHAQKLKSLITDHYIQINKKFIQPYQIENLTNWIFTTNNIDSIQISTNDRRFTCIEVSDKYSQNTQYFRKLYSELTPNIANKFLYYILNTEFNSDISISLPTDLKDQIIESLSPPIQFINDIINNSFQLSTYTIGSLIIDDNYIKIPATNLFEEFKRYCSINNINYSFITQAKFGREIKTHDKIKKYKSNIIHYIINLV